ncbi:MAG: hypothetical protein OJF55_002317 [Rhodanobacteraceae bacterium]|nr:MAG: hypothetical protein OJF55_002317 [Rhodanobacteraceae bacterium]
MGHNMLRPMFAAPLHWASLWSGDAMRRARAIQRPRILMYHCVGHDDVPVEQFRRQLRFLRERFELISLQQLIDRLTSGSTSGNEVVITFDDGVRNQFTVAYPLLSEQGAPATIFACPGLIESGRWIWRTELRLRLALLSSRERMEVARSAGCPDYRTEAILAWAKGLALTVRHDLEARVTALTREFEPTAQQIDQYAPLTWQQLDQMDPRLVTIGCHTSTHPMLTTLPDDLLQAEIAGSRAALERRLGREVDMFCYPNGANSAAVVEVARQHYRAALTTRQDFVEAGTDVFMLPRIPASRGRASFVRRLHRPTA